MIVIACALAVFSAAALAVGTHLQHRGVAAAARSSASGGGNGRAESPSLRGCLTTPVWVLGAALVVVATAANVLALAMAPVALIQPLGVLSLVCAALISTRTSRLRVRGRLLAGIATCVVGVLVFVGGSATVARTGALHDGAGVGLLVLLVVAAVAAGVVLATGAGHVARVTVSGVLFGMVAVSVHAVAPIIAGALFGLPGASSGPGLTVLITVVVLVGVVAALGSWLVQTAYASGPPETVLAGLTVLDPMVAVLVGAVVLHEYTLPSPIITVLLALSALAAVAGIATVVRHHPGVTQQRPTDGKPQRRPREADADTEADAHEPRMPRTAAAVPRVNRAVHGNSTQIARG